MVITGNDSYGARVYAADAVINFGDDAVISVSGEDAKALCVSADDALIKVGNNAQITAEGMNAQALLLWADGNSGKIEIATMRQLQVMPILIIIKSYPGHE